MKSKTLGIEIEYKTKHIELALDDDLWARDSWVVWINGERFDYRTGIGHRKEARGGPNGLNYPGKFAKYINMSPQKTRANMERYMRELESCSKPVPPPLDDVLYSLIMDADALDRYFPDWADEFGYDQDSRNALAIYEACRKNGEKLIKAGITPDEKTREAFRGY